MIATYLSKRHIFTSAATLFKITSTSYAEPLKKKKRIDPAIIKAREDRKRRRIEKEIRRLEKNALQYKPIDEVEVSRELKNSIEARNRVNTVLVKEELERRQKCLLEWSHFKFCQHNEDYKLIKAIIKSKENALQALRSESENLYLEAIEVDLTLIPFRACGPLRTPPIEGFSIIDGDYKDITKKWE